MLSVCVTEGPSKGIRLVLMSKISWGTCVFYIIAAYLRDCSFVTNELFHSWLK